MENKEKKDKSVWETIEVLMWLALVYFAIEGGIKWYINKVKTSYTEKNYMFFSFWFALPIFFTIFYIYFTLTGKK